MTNEEAHIDGIFSRISIEVEGVQVEQITLPWTSTKHKLIWCFPKFEDMVVSVKGRRTLNFLVHADYAPTKEGFEFAVQRVRDKFLDFYKEALKGA